MFLLVIIEKIEVNPGCDTKTESTLLTSIGGGFRMHEKTCTFKLRDSYMPLNSDWKRNRCPRDKYMPLNSD